MDITQYLASRREKGLLSGDYGSYKRQLGRRLLTLRKKLQCTSLQGKKGSAKNIVTTDDIGKNHEFVYLVLLASERAWAHAMHMKAVHNTEPGDHLIPSSTRRHIVSRLQKAASNAGRLMNLLEGQRSAASVVVKLQARAYHASLRGAVAFEKQHWRECLQFYSEAHLIYGSLDLSKDSQKDSWSRDISSTYVEPSLRYAAYRLKIPRSTDIETLVKDHAPREDHELMEEMARRVPNALVEQPVGQAKSRDIGLDDTSKTIQWRSRTVNLEDAATAHALAAAAIAENQLSSLFKSNPGLSPPEKAVAYDELLIASQDAVDGTKAAIDELSADGVPQSDPRMQALQITRTAVHYALVRWRIGRNRILCGDADGASLNHSQPKQSKKSPRKAATVSAQVSPDESKRRILKRFMERVVLYDATVQSLESVEMLPGVAPDQAFLQELHGKRAYFNSLRCLAIARTHSMLGSPKNGLAMLLRAQRLALNANDAGETTATDSAYRPPDLTVSKSQIRQLQELLFTSITEHRGLVELDDYSKAAKSPSQCYSPPLNQALDTYPVRTVDLTKIVSYPPDIVPIPVKPIFLDVAYNYIEYPGQRDQSSEGGAMANGNLRPDVKQEAKKGWFGFGR